MIELENVSKIFKSPTGTVQALDNIYLHVKPGEIFGVIGKSGAGKSTLIRCVNLLETPSHGRVRVNGYEMTELSAKELREARRHIGMIFQHFNLLASRTAYENIAFPLELAGYSPSIIKRRVFELLELVHLENRYQAYPNQLSGGQKQRVAIARALATEPKVLLCDEMTSALDPDTTNTILDLVKEINQQLKLSILLITHEMHVIKRIAHRVAVMDQGKIIEENDVVSLFKNPQTAIALSFTQSNLNFSLPESWNSKLQPHTFPEGALILRITFIGKRATESVIENLIKRFPIDVNILQANLEFLRDEPLGTLLLSMHGDANEMERAKQYLLAKDLKIEELGYVAIPTVITT